MAFGWDDLAILVGSVALGAANNASANSKSNALSREALTSIDALDPYKYNWDRNYQYIPELDQYVALNLDDTAYNNISVDPNVLYAQNKALNELINLSENEGLNSIDRQALQEIINSENANLKGNLDAISQNAMERGIYGSGLELANKLQQAQSSANRNSSQDMAILAQAQQRALDALSNYGNLSSNMRSQDFNEQEKIANARDTIAEKNWQNRQDVSNANVDNTNKNKISNTEIANAQQDANFEKSKTLYGYDEDKAFAKAGQLNKNIDTVGANADRNNQTLGAFTSAYGSFSDSASKKKKDE